MNWRNAESDQWIKDPNYRMLDNIAILSWQWPRGIDFVYISKAIDGVEPVFGEGSSLPLKLYTREEYKANAGYKDIVSSIGKIIYKIYPAVREEGNMFILNQDNQQNEIVLRAEKAKIYYSIKYRKSLFSKQKTVHMTIRTETWLSKDTLCYVKKEGSTPSNIEDGVDFPFASDFEPGLKTLPEISINKNDYMRIFFTDGQKHGELYELIPE